jgi:hypothetical protein
MKNNLALIFAAIVILAMGMGTNAFGGSYTFASDDTWDVYDASSAFVGLAQYVALNATNPPSYPPEATVYGYSWNGWTADASSIPGAYWIWAPGITGETPLASLDQFSFVKTFDLGATPMSGSISIAADDFATVFVNGTLVATMGGYDPLVTFDITPFLSAGINTIQITAQNGPDSFCGITDANYSQNPAGVVFGGTLTFAAVPVPGALVLGGIGTGLLHWLRRRRAI